MSPPGPWVEYDRNDNHRRDAPMSWDDGISESQIGLVRRLADERREALTAKGQWPADIETVQQWMASEVVWGAGQRVETLDRRGA